MVIGNCFPDILDLINRLPHIDLDMCRVLHDFGLLCINDDYMDVGYFQYRGREGHTYQGKASPDHPSPFHHWQVGAASITIAQIGGMMYKIKEVVQQTAPMMNMMIEERSITMEMSVDVPDYVQLTNEEPIYGGKLEWTGQAALPDLTIPAAPMIPRR